MNHKQVITVIDMTSKAETFLQQQQAAAELIDLTINQQYTGGSIIAIGYTAERAEILLNSSTFTPGLTSRPAILAEFVQTCNNGYAAAALEAASLEANFSNQFPNASLVSYQGNITAALELIQTIVGTEGTMAAVSSGTIGTVTPTAASSTAVSNASNMTHTAGNSSSNTTNGTYSTSPGLNATTAVPLTNTTGGATSPTTVPYVSVEYTSQVAVSTTSCVFLGLTEETQITGVDASLSAALQQANIDISAVTLVEESQMSAAGSVKTSEALLSFVSAPAATSLVTTSNIVQAAATLRATVSPGMRLYLM